jgi:gamma-glutamyltranspeptidase / glutathione hydrolase
LHLPKKTNMKMTKIFLYLIFITNIAFSQTGLVTNNAMVVSAREEASQIGIDIIKKGGNAFDAMIATELALAVAFPFAGIFLAVVLWFLENLMVKLVV